MENIAMYEHIAQQRIAFRHGYGVKTISCNIGTDALTKELGGNQRKTGGGLRVNLRRRQREDRNIDQYQSNGDNVEDAMGHWRFLVFYLLCGVIAGLVHSWMLPQSGLPLIGASGAVAGVIAAYLILHPKVTVWVLLLRVIPLKISALIALGLWIVMNFAMALMPAASPIAWWAHVGGIIAGAVLVVLMKRRDVALFDGLMTGS